MARTAGLLGVTPEQGCVALGVVLAAVFTGLLTITVHKFFTPSRGFAWVLAALLLGGGLGTHLHVAAHVTRHHADSMVVKKLLREPSEQEMWWDNKRQHYVFIALFDTHFLFVWTLATTCVLALFKATQRTSPIWSTVAAGCLGLMTLVHVYEGVTLAAIAAGVLLVTWLKRRPIAPPLLTAVLCAAASTVAFVRTICSLSHFGLPATRLALANDPAVEFAHGLSGGLARVGSLRSRVLGSSQRARRVSSRLGPGLRRGRPLGTNFSIPRPRHHDPPNSAHADRGQYLSMPSTPVTDWVVDPPSMPAPL